MLPGRCWRFCWPPAGILMAACGQDLTSADTCRRQGSLREGYRRRASGGARAHLGAHRPALHQGLGPGRGGPGPATWAASSTKAHRGTVHSSGKPETWVLPSAATKTRSSAVRAMLEVPSTTRRPSGRCEWPSCMTRSLGASAERITPLPSSTFAAICRPGSSAAATLSNCSLVSGPRERGCRLSPSPTQTKPQCTDFHRERRLEGQSMVVVDLDRPHTAR